MRKVRKLRNPLSNQLDIFALFALCAHTFNLLHCSSSSFFSGRFGGGASNPLSLLWHYYVITMILLCYSKPFLIELQASATLCNAPCEKPNGRRNSKKPKPTLRLTHTRASARSTSSSTAMSAQKSGAFRVAPSANSCYTRWINAEKNNN